MSNDFKGVLEVRTEVRNVFNIAAILFLDRTQFHIAMRLHLTELEAPARSARAVLTVDASVLVNAALRA